MFKMSDGDSSITLMVVARLRGMQFLYFQNVDDTVNSVVLQENVSNMRISRGET